MTTFVLVHGAWSGAHGFRHVRPLLLEKGHVVLTPSLTGIGERVHLAGPQVDLSTHVADVVNAILYEDVNDIVLLGFSYGGMVVTAALPHIAERIRHLVFLDAFVPADGDSVASLVGLPGETLALGAPWSVPPRPRSFDDPIEAAFSEPRRVPQPLRTFTTPVRLPEPIEGYPFTLTYIKATADARTGPTDPFWNAADHARISPRWRHREIATTHMVASNEPRRLADLLLELA